MSDVAVLKRADEWCRQLGLTVLDPDGWRCQDGVTWLTPITETDFMERYYVSTVLIVHKGK